MPRPFAFAVSFFWMSAFALLAMASSGVVFKAQGGFGMPAMPLPVIALLTIGFAVAATVFLWALVAIILDRGDEAGNADWIARIAFATAIFMVSVLMLASVRFHPLEVLATTALAVAALAASASAVHAEGRVASRAATADSAGKVAGMMAAGAAHNTMLSAISRRAFAGGSKR